jgi:hypothetical protein
MMANFFLSLLLGSNGAKDALDTTEKLIVIANQYGTSTRHAITLHNTRATLIALLKRIQQDNRASLERAMSREDDERDLSWKKSRFDERKQSNGRRRKASTEANSTRKERRERLKAWIRKTSVEANSVRKTRRGPSKKSQKSRLMRYAL